MNHKHFKTKIIYFFLFILFCPALFAQQNSLVDSLTMEIKLTTNPNEKGELYYTLAKIKGITDFATAIKYTQNALALYTNDQAVNKGNAYGFLGGIYSQLSEDEKALCYEDTALYYYQIADDKEGIALVYSHKGAIYAAMNDYVSAYQLMYKSLEINQQIGNVQATFAIVNNLVYIHIALGEYQKSLDITFDALELANEQKDTNSIAFLRYSLGITYTQMDSNNRALSCFDDALDLYLKLGNFDRQALIYSQKSNIYSKQNKMTLALEMSQKAMALKDKVQTKEYQLELQMDLAHLYFDRGEYAQSLQVAEEVWALAKADKNIFYQEQALNRMINSHVKLQQFEKAYFYKLDIQYLQDSLLNAKMHQQTKEVEAKYETAKKEQQNKLLAEENKLEKLRADRNRILLYLSIFVMILILLLSALLVYQYRTHSANLTNELKYKLLRNQMNPHFIFNSLGAIQHYIYQKAPLLAGEYLASFASLVRAILENSMQEQISLNKEIQWLENYLKLQLLRFENQFEYQLLINPQIDLDNILIPPMLTQPFIENALEHGLQGLEYKGKLEVEITINNNLLQIQIRDNGIGLEASQAKKKVKKHTSLAVRITKERLLFLNNKRGNKIDFEMTELPQKGTLVSFSLPIKYQY